MVRACTRAAGSARPPGPRIRADGPCPGRWSGREVGAMQTAARVVVAVGRYGSGAAVDHAVAEAGRRRAELSMVQARDVRTVSEAAGAADLVVAGRFPELAAHLGAPPVCVPDDWRPRLGPRTVVAGIGDPAACPELLAVAAATARLWHA